MARFSCLAVAMLVALLFLLLLITCRSRGFPFSEGNSGVITERVSHSIPIETGRTPTLPVLTSARPRRR